ncbi:MAG: ATPase [Rhodospirillales bacterium]|nr:ATPase [Rhodospirillales bacterium]
MTHPGHVVVVGNEKGGSGKSTVAMHLAVGFLQSGRKVATVDLDTRQATLTRYVANRRLYTRAVGKDVLMPDHYGGEVTSDLTDPKGVKQASDRLVLLLEGARVNHDVVIVDTPGSDHVLSRLAHSYADTLVTPLNDSFIDLDVLAHVDGQRMQVMGPSHYTQMVIEQKQKRRERDGGTLEWIILRNRVSSLASRNTRDVDLALRDLAARVGFRVVPGFTERVIYRELFPIGVTILDLKDAADGKGLSLSHLAARQEVHALVASIGASQGT